MNSWSNLLYATAGGWALGCAVQELRSAPAEQENHQWCSSGRVPVVLMIAVGVSAVLLSIGSFLYHASQTSWGAQVDVASMYWVMNAGLLCATWRWGCRFYQDMLWLRKPIFLALIMSVLIIIDVLMYVYKNELALVTIFSIGMTTIVLMEILLACKATGDKRYLFARLISGVTVTLVGLTFRNTGISVKKRQRKEGLERGGWFCDPDSIFQPHAIWHILTGIGHLVLNDLQCRVPAWRPDANLKSTDQQKRAELQASVLGVHGVDLPSS